MEMTITQLIAPLGCYSVSDRIGTVQRATQSFIHSRVFGASADERKKVLSLILSEKGETPRLRAAVEVFFYRTQRVTAWHTLSSAQQSAKVSEFISNVRSAAARRIGEVMATITEESSDD